MDTVSSGVQNSPLPRLEDNEFLNNMRFTPIGLAYNLTRVALSTDNGNFENTLKRIETGWNAGRVYYSGLVDETIREDYIRRYEAGEDPTLLGLELNNRDVNLWGYEVNANLVEMGGELLFDPLNAVGALSKAGKRPKQTEKASDLGGLYRSADAVEALKVIETTQDEVETVKAWKTVVDAQRKAVDAVENGKILKQEWTRKTLTVDSREKALINAASDFIGNSTKAMMTFIALLGWILWSPSLALIVAPFLFFSAAHLFVTLYEEPTLKRKFGAAYEEYLQKVPRWIPRVNKQ